MKHLKGTAGVCVVVAALVAGCGRAVKPVDIRLAGASFTEAGIAVARLVIANPNRFDLDIIGADYEVTIGDNVCGSGRRDEPFHVGARDSVQAEFDLAIDYASLARSLPQLLEDTVAFTVDGHYTVMTVIGRRQLPFRAERKVALKAEIGSMLQHLFDGEE